MILFAAFMIWAWLPIVIIIFGSRRPREAVLLSFLVAWLFLPTIGFDIPGLPDYTKMTAATLGTFVSVCLFDSARLMAFRFRWYDTPIVVWCVCPFFSSVMSGEGAYDGVSAVVQELFSWGIPYVFGRIYLGDPEGIYRLTRAIAIAGIVYIPFILIEARLSPVFDKYVYGIDKWEGLRLGTFRPHVFFGGGLDLGMWMACTCLAAVALWSSGLVKRLGGFPFWMLTLLLIFATFMVRATGAFLLLLTGLGCIRMVRWTKRSFPAWFLIVIAPFYFTTRLTGLWSGDEVVMLANMVTQDTERTASIQYRFDQEEIMMRSAMKRPIFGWARSGGFNRTADGKDEAISDGLWIIAMGHSGIIGLVALWAMLCLPLGLMVQRFPPRTWNATEAAPPVAMAVLLALCMVDNLSNGLLNPIYALIMGGLVGLAGCPKSRDRSEAPSETAQLRELEVSGRIDEAVEGYRALVKAGRGIAGTTDEGLSGLAGALLASGRLEEADQAFADLVAARLRAASQDPDPALIRSLAVAHEGWARTLARLDRPDRALDQRLKAVDLWSGLASAFPGDPEFPSRRAAALNDLAWLLAEGLSPALRDPGRATELAEDATRIIPDDPAFWNTLGVARYRVGDYRGSLEAIGRSVQLDPRGGSAFDHYFQAMASARLGDLNAAFDWFDRAETWVAREPRSRTPDLERFRGEAIVTLEESGLAIRD